MASLDLRARHHWTFRAMASLGLHGRAMASIDFQDHSITGTNVSRHPCTSRATTSCLDHQDQRPKYPWNLRVKTSMEFQGHVSPGPQGPRQSWTTYRAKVEASPNLVLSQDIRGPWTLVSTTSLDLQGQGIFGHGPRPENLASRSDQRQRDF